MRKSFLVILPITSIAIASISYNSSPSYGVHLSHGIHDSLNSQANRADSKCGSDMYVLSQLLSFTDSHNKNVKKGDGASNNGHELKNYFSQIIHKNPQFHNKVTVPIESGNPYKVQDGLKNLETYMNTNSKRGDNNRRSPNVRLDSFVTVNNVAWRNTAVGYTTVAGATVAVAAAGVVAAAVSITLAFKEKYHSQFHNTDDLVRKDNLAQFTSKMQCNA